MASSFGWHHSSQLFLLVVLIYLTFTPQAHGHILRTLWKRDPAISNSPSGNYNPVLTTCPANLFLRKPDDHEAKLSQAESNYIQEKSAKSIPLWEDYLARVNLQDFDAHSFLLKAKQNGGSAGETLPNIAFSVSGGGARALCVGASILDAFDSRHENSNINKVGGVLQLANYAAGVSGGSWLLGYWATSNFPRINPNEWKLDEENDLWDWNIAKHYPKVYQVVRKKKKAGFPVSVVDAWGRLLSRHFIIDPSNKDPLEGKAVLWSSIRQTPAYQSRAAPFVMAVAVTRPNEKTDFTQNTPTYEFTPEEFGVWHPYLNVSIPIDFLGSPPDSHNQPGSSNCVRGFDNAGFVMGISSNIFSAGDDPNAKDVPGFIRALTKIVDGDDWEGKVPNTFKGLTGPMGTNSAMFQDSQRHMLLMADSGFPNENIPIFPFLQSSRKVDVIIAIDSSDNHDNLADSTQVIYPNGTSLYQIYSKTQLPQFRGYRMPKIPNPFDGSFQKLGYNKRPTFFGCDCNPQTPLVIYLPNYAMVGKSNIKTTQTTYSPELISEIFRNGYAIATQNEGPTKNEEWPACLACALIDHQLQRNSQARTKQCQRCFDFYCAQG